MIENKILSAIVTNREAYNVIKSNLDESNLSDIGKILYKYIGDYYAIDSEASSVDRDIIISRLEHDYPKKKGILCNAVLELKPVSVPNILEEYNNLRKRTIADDLATRLLDGDFGDQTYELIDNLLKVGKASVAPEDNGIYIGGSIYDLIDDFLPENLIKMHPGVVNRTLKGGVPPGTHVVLFARPEMGKSLFSINMASQFLRDGHKVLYVGNEDPQKAMRLRFVSNLSGRTLDQVLAQPDTSWDKAYDNGFDNLIFIGRGDTSVHMVEDLAEEFSPKVIVVDQMRNLSIRGKLSKVETLEYIAMNLRRIYKDANAVGISITQAGDSASGKKVLTMGDVDFSNTGIPATADLMIGIGADDVMEQNGIRVLTFCKNKVSGDHSSVTVKVIPNLNRVEDL